uniref:Secreted protein n=1 Tax=Ixodes ricinus TaxID=34613 RepID=A0A6B0USE8_IXORI
MVAAWRRLLLCGARVGTALPFLNRGGTSATGAPQHVAELDVSLERGSRWRKEVSGIMEKLFTRFRAVVRQPCLCHFLTSSVAEGRAVLCGVSCVYVFFVGLLLRFRKCSQEHGGDFVCLLCHFTKLLKEFFFFFFF